MKLAEESGFHFTYISDIEGGWRNVSLETILRLARTFGVTPAKLVRGLRADDQP